MYRLKENVILSKKRGLTLINYGTTQYEIEDSDYSIYELLSINKTNISKDIGIELLEFLKKEYLIVKNWEKPENIKYDRFERYLFYLEDILTTVEKTPVDIFENVIKKEKILIVGLGGIGTVVLTNLLKSGFSDYMLVDGDKVDVSNLNRQIMFNLSDVGISKVKVIKDKILSEDSDVIVKEKEIYVYSDDELQNLLDEYNPNIIINCADQPKYIDELIYKAALRRNIPSFSGNVGISTGTYGPIAHLTKTFNDNKGIKGSSSSSNMIIGALLSEEVIQFILKDYTVYSERIFSKSKFDFIKYTNEKMGER